MGSSRVVLAGLLFLGFALHNGQADGSCHGLRHLANGRTFFRYGGIYATFTCNPGFRVYGYHTSSCVSGRWTRASPVCVAAGCPSSGSMLHGSSTVNQDRSLIFFKCDKGYKLFGSPVLYCNGKTWNSTEPVCKESDIMSSDKFKHLSLIKANLGQSLNAPSALRNILRIQYGNIANSAAKDIFHKQELLSELPRSSNPKSGQRNVALHQLQVSNSVPDNQIEDVYLQEHHQSGRTSSWSQSPSKDSNKEPAGYQKFFSKALEVSLATTSPTSMLSVTMSTFKAPIISSSKPAKDSMFSSSTASYTFKSTASDSPLFNESTLSELPASSAPREEIPPLPTSAPDLKQLSLTSAMEVEIETTVSAPNVPSPSINDSSPLEQLVLKDNSVTATLPRYGTVTSALKGDSSHLSSQVSRATPLALEHEIVTAPSSNTRSASLSWLQSISGVHRIDAGNFATPQKVTPIPVHSNGEHSTMGAIYEVSTNYSNSTPFQSISEEDTEGNLISTRAETLLGENVSFQGTASAPQEIETDSAIQARSQDIFRGDLGMKYGPNSTISLGPNEYESSVPVNLDIELADDLQSVLNSAGQSLAIVSSLPQNAVDHGRMSAEPQKDLQLVKKASTMLTPEALGKPSTCKDRPVTVETDVTAGQHNQQFPAMQNSTDATSPDILITNQRVVNVSAEQFDATEHTSVRNDLASFNSTSDWEGQASSAGVNSTQTEENQAPFKETLFDKINILPDSFPDRATDTAVLYPNFVEITVDKRPVGPFKRRPVCPYPPLPTHGTFYFRTLTNPSHVQYKYYVQYSCYPGYTLSDGDVYSFCLRNGTWSGVTPACLEVTPCAVNNGGCSQVCKAGSQKQTECSCREGFTLLEDSRTCRDVNECTEGQHYCQQACVNTFGSYECSCRPGYLLADDERSCSDRDECTVNNGGCLHHCSNTFGSYRCYCEPGFELEKDQRHCRDIDECQTSIGIAGCLFGCINTLGSFLCHCPEGYTLGAMDGHCRDIDECAENNGRGLCAMECQNAPGSYRCSCSYGYRLAGDGRSCIAECPSGYRKQRNSTERSSPHQRNQQCVDINECQELQQEERRCEWRCLNLPGSYRCICPQGYRMASEGYHCEDINECTYQNGGCSHICLNNRGGYKCACPKEYSFSPYSRKKCQPVKT
ncbi:uncharacterized protein LOC121320641 [Polyodon spathula]|uniref:uncharacterized protein LOC121320641 n=1 Tax=Polyodon spathula TaxID=7913 RepID=UPI001B7EC88E|nr:uncharacterized protein LOC121320641 [Polyodon spathula]